MAAGASSVWMVRISDMGCSSGIPVKGVAQESADCGSVDQGDQRGMLEATVGGDLIGGDGGHPPPSPTSMAAAWLASTAASEWDAPAASAHASPAPSPCRRPRRRRRPRRGHRRNMDGGDAVIATEGSSPFPPGEEQD